MQANKQAARTPRETRREFDIERKHTAGQFLRAHPEALKAVKAHSKEAEDSFSIAKRFRVAGA
jgi:ABC-type nitrate/sulfonate/bicarbonate transport system substrate-binding protein